MLAVQAPQDQAIAHGTLRHLHNHLERSWKRSFGVLGVGAGSTWRIMGLSKNVKKYNNWSCSKVEVSLPYKYIYNPVTKSRDPLSRPRYALKG